jgi:hypothetical protein
MGCPLKPLAANDISQAAEKKDHCHGQKKDIEHGESLPTNIVFDTAL